MPGEIAGCVTAYFLYLSQMTRPNRDRDDFLGQELVQSSRGISLT
jgi:hypothetical protein